MGAGELGLFTDLQSAGRCALPGWSRAGVVSTLEGLTAVLYCIAVQDWSLLLKV